MLRSMSPAIAAIAVVLGCGSDNAAPARPAEVVEEAGAFSRMQDSRFGAYVVPAESFAGRRPEFMRTWSDSPVAEGFWTPSVDDARRAETRIVDTMLRAAQAPSEAFPADPPPRRTRFLQELPNVIARLDDYGTQLAGVVIGGRRLVLASFFLPDDIGLDGMDPAKEWIGVDDGGSSYWRILYDPEFDCCSDFETNGDA